MLKQYSSEHDLIGDKTSLSTPTTESRRQRAMDNFDMTGVPISHFPELIRALAMFKKAAALANIELGNLNDQKKNAIVIACNEIINEGRWYDQLPVDLIQGGAGLRRPVAASPRIRS